MDFKSKNFIEVLIWQHLQYQGKNSEFDVRKGFFVTRGPGVNESGFQQ